MIMSYLLHEDWRKYFFNVLDRGGLLRHGMGKDMVSRTGR